MKHSILSRLTGIALAATCACWVNGPALAQAEGPAAVLRDVTRPAARVLPEPRIQGGTSATDSNYVLYSNWTTDGDRPASVTSTNSAAGITVTSARSYWQNSNYTFFGQIAYSQAPQVQVAPATVTLTEVLFSPAQVAKNNGQILVRFELAPSSGVPANTVVRVEAFVAANPNGVAFTLSPSPANKQVTVAGGSGTYLVDFVLTTAADNTATGQIQITGRILDITSGNSAVPVQSRPAAPNDAVQSTTLLAVQP